MDKNSKELAKNYESSGSIGIDMYVPAAAGRIFRRRDLRGEGLDQSKLSDDNLELIQIILAMVRIDLTEFG